MNAGRPTTPAALGRFARRARRLLVHSVDLAEAWPAARAVTGGEPLTLRTPELPSTRLLPDAEHLRAGTHLVPPPRLTILEDVLYWPGREVLLTRGRRVVKECLNGEFRPEKLRVGRIFGPVTRRVPGVSAVFRSLYNGYYHCLVDNLPRVHALANLAEVPFRLLHGTGLRSYEEFFLDGMRPADAVTEELDDDGLYSLERVLLPGFVSSPLCGVVRPDYVAGLLRRFAPDRPRNRHRRILVLRRGSDHKGRRFVNEEEVVRRLGALGFEAVLLETLPLEKQIQMFYDAECVVGAHGAGLANLLFGERLHVVEAFPGPEHVPHYRFLAASLGHQYSSVCGEATHRFADIALDCDRVIDRLRDFGMSV